MNERTGRMIGAGLLAVAVVGGVGFTAVRVAGADRDAGKPVWNFPKADAKGQDGQASKDPSGLRALLLPYDSGTIGYGRGPDIGEFGSDAALSGREATALSKQEIRDLPPQALRKVTELIDKERIKGMAVRSYAALDRYDTNDRALTISFELVRMENSASVRSLSTTQNEFLAGSRIFSKGPAIKGYENAACFLTPTKADAKLDRMVCSAYVGDVLVTVNASGQHPLGTNAVALLIGRQLDRIKDPGKAV
ncbi:hypothetical protein [Streptomyces sp. NPDC006739]|uniref:hypothetical protein n=1 Tax=Streptomyces sp. NPDC006739 TaxID=3364763 RepID=UPI00367E4400